uniref:MSC domain-containing protein n=1 Tax=Caenorhabditis tropicalis TaxID=1561998 RepID=A0A1I7UUK9_9PELO
MVDVEKMTSDWYNSLLVRKELKKLLAAGGKTPARTPSASTATKTISKPNPKPAIVPKSPARKAEKTPDTTRRSLPRAANTTVNSTFNRSEVEEMSDSDDDREEEEEILSPKSRQTSFRSSQNTTTTSVGRGRPVSSTPTKKLSPVHRPSPVPTPSSAKVSSTKTTINTTTRIPTTPRSIHVPVPGLITDFTPSFATFGSDRPGATPPRKSIYTSKVSNVLHELGHTTGEEDNDDFEGQESSRIIYKTEEPPKGIVKNAWNKVLGYGFNASKTPGESYDLRAGSSRIRVQKNPKTGKVTVKQSNIFNDSLQTALYVVIILFVVLSVAYVFTTYQPKTANFSGYWGVLKSAARDSLNFFYNYAILPIISIGLIVVIGAGLFFGHRKYKEAKELEDAKLYELIERITELIKESHADGDPYVSQPHVRDVMFPPSKRRSAEMARWEEAVKFIDTHESRVATDIVVLSSGNECAVWKWIGNNSQRRW